MLRLTDFGAHRSPAVDVVVHPTGKAESSSNVETTLTQLLQHYSILAQVSLGGHGIRMVTALVFCALHAR